MSYSGINLGNVRIENCSAILKLPNGHADLRGVSEQGVLYEKGETAEKRAGRKKS